MLTVKFKERNILKRIKKLRFAASLGTATDTKKISTVGILTTEELYNKYDFQQLAIDILELRNPKIYSFRPFFKGQDHSYKHFTEKDFDWRGEIVDKSFKNFLNQPFDLLICYFDEPNLYIEYAANVSKAKYKIGFCGALSEIFQFEVRTELNNYEAFFSESKRYLTILQKL